VVLSRSASLIACASLTALALAAAPALAGKDEPRPYTLAVDVGWGDPIGPESVREDVERAVVHELGRRGCFAALERYEPDDPTPSDLLLTIDIDEFFEQSRFGLSVAGVNSPNAPPDTGRAQVAELRAMFDIRLSTVDGDRTVRAKRFGENASYRPVMSEDPRYVAHQRWLESLQRSISHFLCKGSQARFEKEVAQAEPPEDAAGR